jgi:two-component system sensor kinase
LNNHPVISLGNVPDWDPICIRDKNGELSGMAGDYKRIIEKTLPITLKLAPEAPWPQTLDSARSRKIDAVMLLGRTPARDSYLAFTDILIDLPYVIVTRVGAEPVRNISDLAGKRVSIRESLVSHEWLAAEHPEIPLAIKTSNVSALRAVAMGEVTAFVGSLPDALHIISQGGISHLKVAADAGFTNHLRIGVRSDWPELVSILNKALAGVTPAEHRAIWDRWIHEPPRGVDPRILYGLAGLFIASTIAILSFHNIRLRKAYAQVDQKVRERTLELEKLDEELKLNLQRLSAANKELEGFSYSVSHDLRVPLRAIDGFSRRLVEEYSGVLDSEGKRLLGVVIKAARKMDTLIDDLLIFSMVGRKEISVSTIDMEYLARAAFEELTAGSGKNPPEFMVNPMPQAKADPSLIKQVALNYLGNAIKFSESGATPRIEMGGRSAGRENIYYVKDNGAGFDMKYAGKLFGVFQRLHTEAQFPGTGVGLAIAQRIVSRFGGRVWAEGETGKGAAFYFTLPFADSPDSASEEGLLLKENFHGGEGLYSTAGRANPAGGG